MIPPSSTDRRATTAATPRALKGQRHRLPRPATTPGACGTTGSATSTRPLHRPQPGGTVRRQGGAGDRRFVGHRLATAHKFAEAGATTIIPARQREHSRGREFEAGWSAASAWIHRGPGRHGRLRPLVPGSRNHGGGISLQQCRPLASAARSRSQLRPLPRLRTHDAAELLRRLRSPWPPARMMAEAGHQHQLDRRADQRAAVLGLRGVQGGARRLDTLRPQRVRRPGHLVHDHQHAAGAHADDRADRPTTTCRRRRRSRRPDRTQACIFKWCASPRLGITG